MTAAFRGAHSKNEHASDIPAPTPWRHSRTPSVGSLPNILSSSSALSRPRSIIIQLLLIFGLFSYICLPSHTVRQISSKSAIVNVSQAGRKVLSKLSEVATVISSDSDNTGVAIVAACMNRQKTLEKVLPTWLAVEGVDEIVIIDWGSDPPLKPIIQPERDPRLKLYRVNAEPSWVLSRAYNLAVNKTDKAFIIRTDCDYTLDPGILNAHRLNETEAGFYSGNWVLARDENEVHLNGAMIFKREVFVDVGGYDERIQTYGWDDEDLYTRLTSNNIEKLNISYDHIGHVHHGDGSRAQKGVKFAQVQIDLNQLLLEKLPLWSRNDSRGPNSSKYKVTSDDSGTGYTELEAVEVPKPLKERVGLEIYEESWALALGRRLADDYHVPWDILETMDSDGKELMLRSLMILQSDLENDPELNKTRNGKSGNKVVPTKARLMLVHCMHGLGNRLRALGSALAFAKNSHRVPVIIWESDAHIAAEFDALFNASNFVLMKEFKPKWPFTDLHTYDASWNHFRFYNYMEVEEGAEKGKLVVNEPDKHIYYKGAYIMEAPEYTWWEADNEELQKLKPVDTVTEHLQRLDEQNIASAIGVHIRNRTLAADIKNVDFSTEYGSEAAATMEHWRSQSSYRNFIAEMKRIIEEEDKNARFYVATDTREVIPLMEKSFPDRILSTKRSCDDRDSECVKYAVVDMYALSRTKKLLGSNWSSYTEMAERLGGLKARLAGQDFGPSASIERTQRHLDHNLIEKSEEELAAEENDRQFDSSQE